MSLLDFYFFVSYHVGDGDELVRVLEELVECGLYSNIGEYLERLILGL